MSLTKKAFTQLWKNSDKMPRESPEGDKLYGADVTVYESIDPAITTYICRLRQNWHGSLQITGADHGNMKLWKRCLTAEAGTVSAEETPFYATMGGQEGGHRISSVLLEGEFKVEDTVKLIGGKIGHVG